jgi:hypothetical protein
VKQSGPEWTPGADRNHTMLTRRLSFVSFVCFVGAFSKIKEYSGFISQRKGNEARKKEKTSNNEEKT